MNISASLSPVVLMSSALDELDGKIIVRGVLSMDSIAHILHDDYQKPREITSQPDKMIRSALSKGRGLPDIVLGMRGQRFVEKDGLFHLLDSVYVIDGLQRITAILRYREMNPDFKIHLGATVHFDTTLAFEREMFVTLNTSSLPVSPNALLYTLRHENLVVDCLYSMSTKDDKFVLKGKVAWKQNQARHELISVRTVLICSGSLHRHILVGGGNRILDLAQSMYNSMNNLGLKYYRENLRTFFNLVDECFGIRNVYFKGGANHLKQNFLRALALMLSNHTDFWETNNKKLVIEASLRRKLRGFPVNDPTVAQLSNTGGGLATIQLARMFADFLNSGKRTRHLTPRNAQEMEVDEGEEKSEAA